MSEPTEPGVTSLDDLLEFIAARLADARPDIGTPAPELTDDGVTIDQIADAVPYGSQTGQNVWQGEPVDQIEYNRRRHVIELVVDLVDNRVDPEVRNNALRHALTCDPMRVITALARLAGETLDAIDSSGGARPGTSIRVLRAATPEEADKIMDEEVAWVEQQQAGADERLAARLRKAVDGE